jgi:hypothetical protein
MSVWRRYPRRLGTLNTTLSFRTKNFFGPVPTIRSLDSLSQTVLFDCTAADTQLLSKRCRRQPPNKFPKRGGCRPLSLTHPGYATGAVTECFTISFLTERSRELFPAKGTSGTEMTVGVLFRAVMFGVHGSCKQLKVTKSPVTPVAVFVVNVFIS